jgi:hypothetical protein
MGDALLSSNSTYNKKNTINSLNLYIILNK